MSGRRIIPDGGGVLRIDPGAVTRPYGASSACSVVEASKRLCPFGEDRTWSKSLFDLTKSFWWDSDLVVFEGPNDQVRLVRNGLGQNGKFF